MLPTAQSWGSRRSNIGVVDGDDGGGGNVSGGGGGGGNGGGGGDGGNGAAGGSVECGSGGGAEPVSHPLHARLRLTYMRRNREVRGEAFASGLRELGTFDTVESFWSFYSHILPPHKLPLRTDVYLFRENILPLWEDPQNVNGGRWIIRYRKGFAARPYEDLVLAFVGNELERCDLVCGIALSVRTQDDLVSMWTKSSNTLALEKMRASAKRLMMDASGNVIRDWEFKPHSSNAGPGDTAAGTVPEPA